MTLDEIKKLKDKVYELEGLLELAQLREDKLGEIVPLILSRLNALSPKVEYDVKETKEEETEVYEMPVEGIFGTSVDEVDNGSEVKKEVEDREASVRPAPVESVETPVMETVQRPLFCLNDRFRFRRTLFKGSEEAFSDAMQHITQMDDYEEAMGYFLDEYGWDPENEEVQAFLDIIKTYF